MKAFLLDIYPIQLEIRNALLTGMLDSEAFVTDITPILVACFEVSLYGECRTFDTCATKQMTDLGVSEKQAVKTMESVCYYFDVLLAKSSGLISPDKQYVYKHVGVTDFMIKEKQIPEPNASEIAMIRFKHDVEQGISNGDWFSERIRQLIGLY